MLLAAREFVTRGYVVDIVVGQNRGDLREEVPEGARVVELEAGAKWRALGFAVVADPSGLRPLLRWKLPGKLRYLPSLVRYFRSARPDAIYAATAPFNLMAVWARRLANLDSRVVVSEHNQLSGETVGNHKWRYDCPPSLLCRGYLQADGIVSVSNGVAGELSEHAGIPANRITTVYNPVVGPVLEAKTREAVDHPWFAAGEPPVIIGVGKLKPQKDFPMLIRAFARVREKRPARLVILGGVRNPDKDAEYLDELKALPRALGVADDVDFAGFVSNPFAFMSRAALFVLSSRWEGLPTVLIEALACGCPVVSTDCPSGPAEILDHGRVGPLVPVGDDAALADAMIEVLDHPPAPETLKARTALFTVENAIDRYLELMFGREPARTAGGRDVHNGLDTCSLTKSILHDAGTIYRRKSPM
jgi:glycosyltransferase involved in cell wall biosynthesis